MNIRITQLLLTILCALLSSFEVTAQGTTLATATNIIAGSGAGTTTGAGPSLTLTCTTPSAGYSTGCSVGWYSFTVTNPAAVSFDFQSTSGSDQDMGASVFSANDCTTTDPTNLTALDCDRDGPASGGVQLSLNAAPSRTYYVMVWDFGCDATVSYNYTMTETALTVTNDEPCTAAPLTVGGGALTGILGDYTESCLALDPPNTCTNSTNGGYIGGNACRDAWYSVTVPSSGSLTIEFESIAGSADLTAAAYSGTSCNNADMTLITCDDDGGVGSLPELDIFGQVPGSTVYIRIWDFGCNSPTAEFQISSSMAPIHLVANLGTLNVDCGVVYDFYDSGGPGIVNGNTDYQLNEDYTVTFCATAGNNVRLSFLNKFNSTVSTGTIYRPACDGTHALDVDAGGNSSTLDGDLADYLTFYDGTSSAASTIAVYTGETLSYPSPGTILSSGQCLTVNFTSSDIINEEGWEAKVDCVSDVSPQTLALTCPGSADLFSDDNYNAGGATTIQPDDQYIVTICPDVVGLCVFAGALTGLEALMLNQNSDYLYVYNGTDDTSSPIAIFTGSGDNSLTTTENLTNITGITAFTDWTPANAGGCLTFKLVTNNATNYPDWVTTAGFDIDLFCVECDLGNGGGTDCATATEITQNGFWAGTNVDDTGDGYDATYNPTGGDPDETNGSYTSSCLDATGAATGSSNITRLENTLWYHFKTPAVCQDLNLEIVLNYISCQNERADDNGIQFVIWEGTPGADISCPATGLDWDNSNDNNATGSFNMLGCYDKLTAGGSISVSALSDNTDYYIMVDGFTGQHCFFDLYIDIFPADIKNIMTDASTSPANFCSGSANTATITAEAMADVNFVYETNSYTSITAASAAATRTTAYTGTVTTLNTSPISPTPGATSADPSIASYDLAGSSLPTNTGCAIEVYNVYIIAEDTPVTFADDAACFPFQVTQVVVYPEPLMVITNTGTESSCGTPIAILQAADGTPCLTQSGIGIGAAATGSCSNNGDVLNYDFSGETIATALAGSPGGCSLPASLTGAVICANCVVGTANIGDFVFYDYNNDGIYNAADGDYPLAGVMVELFNSANVSQGTATTDANGNYLFTSIPAGDYYVQFTTPTGYAVSGAAPLGDSNNNITDANGTGTTPTFAFDGMNNNLTIDAGFTGTGSIGDYVWEDTDGDTNQNEAGTGIDGVVLTLIEAGTDGMFGTGDDIVFPTMTTSGGGNYDFTNLPPGDYQVDITGGEPAGFNLTTSNDPTGTITLTTGQDYNDADFGFQPAPVCVPDNGTIILNTN